MKKVLNIMLAFVALIACVSCSDDNDSNPTLKIPESFVLNTPAYAQEVYDLQRSTSVALTTTQPDYGYTAAVVYTVQVAVKSDFSEFESLSTTFTSTVIDADAKEIAVALVGLLGVEKEEDYPTAPFPVYFRLKADLATGGAEVLSNIIELSYVKGYFALEDLSIPENMYIIGSFCGWDWSKSTSMVPVHSNPGMFWAIQYLGKTEEGANPELKFNWVKSWEAGDSFGMKNATIDDASKTYAAISGDDNIVVGNPGWYLIVVSTEIEGRSYKHNVQFLSPDVYLTGNPSGGYDVFDATRLFTVPDNGNGYFVSPAFVAGGELRMCVKLEGIDWWKSELIILNEKIEYRGAGDDQDRVNVTSGKKAYLNFSDGTGKVE